MGSAADGRVGVWCRSAVHALCGHGADRGRFEFWVVEECGGVEVGGLVGDERDGGREEGMAAFEACLGRLRIIDPSSGGTYP